MRYPVQSEYVHVLTKNPIDVAELGLGTRDLMIKDLCVRYPVQSGYVGLHVLTKNPIDVAELGLGKRDLMIKTCA